MLGDYLKDILPKVFGNEFAAEKIEESVTSESTYFHIRRFARTNGIEGVPQQ
jgi:hypothetical protein